MIASAVARILHDARAVCLASPFDRQALAGVSVAKLVPRGPVICNLGADPKPLGGIAFSVTGRRDEMHPIRRGVLFRDAGIARRRVSGLELVRLQSVAVVVKPPDVHSSAGAHESQWSCCPRLLPMARSDCAARGGGAAGTAQPRQARSSRSRPANCMATQSCTLYIASLPPSLDIGSVASKPAAVRWVEGTLPGRFSDLIGGATTRQQTNEQVTENELRAALAFLEYTNTLYQQWRPSSTAEKHEV